MSPDEMHGALQRHFGFDTFRPGQAAAIQQLLSGRDTLVVMPTGSGKSLCYQLPALLQDGTTLVISPLIALMKDQVDALTGAGIAATAIHSALDGASQGERLAGLAAGRWRLCYVAPERLRNRHFLDAIAHVPLSLVAVDEAHCISRWGHDFRPEYRSIGDFVSTAGRPPIVALTATATPQVQDDIARQLQLEQPFRQVTGFNRPNLHFSVQYAPGETLKAQRLKAFLDGRPAGESGVIYVGRRREAVDVAALVRELCGRSTVFYHGGLKGDDRAAVQDDWMSGRAEVVVATNAFGMGVDKPDVRFVVHYTLPGTVEGYYQEAGRAGRDGAAADCMLLHDPSDARLHEWFIEQDELSLPELRKLYGHLREEGRRSGGLLLTSPSQLSTLMEWRSDGKARQGLKLLEEAGLISSEGESGGLARWRLVPVRGRVDMATPLAEVQRRVAARRRLLQNMLEYARSHDCRRQVLLDYFGDATPPVAARCCDNCLRPPAARATQVAARPEEMAPLYVLDAVAALSYGVGRDLLMKILAGSRAAGMNRYYDHPQFGLLGHLRRKEIRALIDALLTERYLQLESGRYPVLALSETGREAVAGRLAIPLAGIRSQPLPSLRPLPMERVEDTVAETRRLLDEGYEPEAIAIERGLTVSTIFNHLAKGIEQGQIALEQVVPDAERRLIREAVEAVGSFYLSPIKARLPDEISYGKIRCVVAALQREREERPAETPPAAQVHRLERLLAWRRGEARRLNQPPFFLFSNAVLNAIAAAAPTDLAMLEEVRGVGPEKAAQYGAQILELIGSEQGGAESAAPPRVEPYLDLAAAAIQSARAVPDQGYAEADEEDLARLRHWRREVARSQGVPAYIVFKNATLRELVRRRPTTLDEIAAVPGIGPTKVERYGEAVLSLLGGAE